MRRTTLLVVALLCVSLAHAWMDDTHAYLVTEFCGDDSFSTDLKTLVCSNFDACIAGSVAPDLSVLWYFESFPSKYTVTHAKGFCKNLIANAYTPREKVFAHCACMGHHVDDFVSHYYYVPGSIRMSHTPNFPAHIFAEEKANDYVITRNPTVGNLLNDNLEKWDDFTPLLQRALANENQFDAQKVGVYWGKLVSEITCSGLVDEEVAVCQRSYYSGWRYMWAVPWYFSAFAIVLIVLFALFIIKLLRLHKTLNWLGWCSLTVTAIILLLVGIAFYGNMTDQAFAYMQRLSAPITAVWPTPDIESTLDMAVDLMKEYAKTGTVDAPPSMYVADRIGDIPFSDAHGFGVLKKANLGLWSLGILICVVTLLAGIWLAYSHFSGTKLFWSWFQK